MAPGVQRRPEQPPCRDWVTAADGVANGPARPLAPPACVCRRAPRLREPGVSWWQREQRARRRPRGAPGRARGRTLEPRRGRLARRRPLDSCRGGAVSPKPPPDGRAGSQASELAVRGLHLRSCLGSPWPCPGGRFWILLRRAPRSLTEGACHLCPRCRLLQTGARGPSCGADRACESRPRNLGLTWRQRRATRRF